MLCTGASPHRCGLHKINFPSNADSRCSMIQTHLVIETTFFIQIVKELGVGFVSPEVHIGYLKVAPDCSCAVCDE